MTPKKKDKVHVSEMARWEGFGDVIPVGPCLDARDRFAMAALTGITAGFILPVDTKGIAAACYQIADAMLAQRKIKPTRKDKK